MNKVVEGRTLLASDVYEMGISVFTQRCSATPARDVKAKCADATRQRRESSPVQRTRCATFCAPSARSLSVVSLFRLAPTHSEGVSHCFNEFSLRVAIVTKGISRSWVRPFFRVQSSWQAPRCET